jgi:hypothetical protein
MFPKICSPFRRLQPDGAGKPARIGFREDESVRIARTQVDQLLSEIKADFWGQDKINKYEERGLEWRKL